MNSGALIDYFDLVTRIPVGVCKFLMDEKYTLLYGNQCFYQLYGYTPEQLKAELNNELLRAVFSGETNAVSNALDTQCQSGGADFRIEHRIRQRDGTLIWVLVSGTFTSHEGLPAVYGIVLDITDRKETEEQLRINEERFRLALSQTDSTIFDYDIASRVMIHADRSAESFGLSYETKNVPDALVINGVVHPDSVDGFLEMYRQICSGAPAASSIIQARLANGRYVWQKITMTNIFDQSGRAVRAVGLLEDIDKQVRREINLLELSQRDALTGLYHKSATESAIATLLEDAGCPGFLLILDIDRFKEINDHYGHLFGDKVLSESARRIAALCRQTDVIGRIGGDEFLLYFPSSDSCTTAAQKAEDIRKAFQKDVHFNDLSASVSCTIGISRFPDDGDSFESLYHRADIALYEAKRNGRDQCCLYTADMGESLDWFPRDNTAIDA